MTLAEIKKEAIKEAKYTGKNQIVFILMEKESYFHPKFAYCDSELFENEVDNDMVFLPIGEVTEDSKFVSLQLSLF